jgi:hypothetical protein
MTKIQAESLAVRYHAYLQAVFAEDDAGIVLWGPALADIQRQTGIEMITNVGAVVEKARARMLRAA